MRTKWRTLLLILFGGITAIILAEGTLQLVKPAHVIPELVESYQFNCFEKGTYYWVALRKNATCPLISIVGGFDPISIHTNSLGLRSDEIPRAKDQNRLRILVLGDSFTMGLGVKDDQSYPKILEKNLQASGIPADVINAGLTTADIGYYYLFLKNELRKIQPDIVIVGVYMFNDIHDEQMRPVWSEKDENGLPLRIDSATNYVDKNGILYDKSLPWYLKTPIIRNSYLANMMFSSLLPPSQRGIPLISEQLCLYKKSCHTLDNEKMLSKKLLLEMKNITRENNAELLTVMIPAEFQLYDQARYKFRFFVPLSPTEKKLLDTEYADFFKKKHIPYLDLLPVFAAHTGKAPYYKNDDHWNALGHKVAGNAISDMMKDTILTNK